MESAVSIMLQMAQHFTMQRLSLRAAQCVHSALGYCVLILAATPSVHPDIAPAPS